MRGDSWTEQGVIRLLTDKYGAEPAHAKRSVEIARAFDSKAVPVDSGMVLITWVKAKGTYRVREPLKKVAKTVAQPTATRYSCNPRGHTADTANTGGMRTMTRGAAQAEVEEYDTERDLTPYVDKEPTVKLQDYHEWLENVLGIKIDIQSMFLGVTLYPDFQRSDFNRNRTAERRAERAAEAEARSSSNGKSETEDGSPAPKRRGRPPKAAAEAEPAKAPKRRGRPKAGAAAPF